MAEIVLTIFLGGLGLGILIVIGISCWAFYKYVKNYK
jgi:uncharacterized membrane protein